MLRTYFPVVVIALGLAACATSERWSKAGADSDAVDRDLSECQAIGREMALKQYPHMAGSAYSPSGMILSQQQDNANRASAQASVVNDCMTRKGYKRGA
ncbi:MAG: hypothetical protein U1E23_16090 [Reyranellaceae bacterium]